MDIARHAQTWAMVYDMAGSTGVAIDIHHLRVGDAFREFSYDGIELDQPDTIKLVVSEPFMVRLYFGLKYIGSLFQVHSTPIRVEIDQIHKLFKLEHMHTK